MRIDWVRRHKFNSNQNSRHSIQVNRVWHLSTHSHSSREQIETSTSIIANHISLLIPSSFFAVVVIVVVDVAQNVTETFESLHNSDRILRLKIEKKISFDAKRWKMLKKNDTKIVENDKCLSSSVDCVHARVRTFFLCRWLKFNKRNSTYVRKQLSFDREFTELNPKVDFTQITQQKYENQLNKRQRRSRNQFNVQQVLVHDSYL